MNLLISCDHEINFGKYDINTENFDGCFQLVKYLNYRGIYDTSQINENLSILVDSFLSDQEINLFLIRGISSELVGKKINQVVLAEFIIEYYFDYRFDLLNKKQIDRFFTLVECFFPEKYPTKSRKNLGKIIRRSKKLISYSQGKYILESVIEKQLNYNDLYKLITIIDSLLEIKEEIDPQYIYKKYNNLIATSNICNSHELFSILKFIDKGKKIKYYRNTFNQKFRRNEK